MSIISSYRVFFLSQLEFKLDDCRIEHDSVCILLKETFEN